MTPFQEFRLWARRAPGGERAAAAVAAATTLALLIWVIVPATSGNANASGNPNAFGGALPSNSAGPGAGPGGTAPGANPGGAAAGATGAGGAAAGGSGGGATAAGTGTGTHSGNGSFTGPGGKTCPGGSAKGVTNSQIKVAVGITNIAGLNQNSTFGTASTQAQRSYYAAAISDLNARGGAGCRQVVPKYYDLDPTSNSQLQQQCLNMAKDGMFALLDSGGLAQSNVYPCFAQNHIVYIGSYLIDEDVREKGYPYLFEFASYDRVYHDTVQGLKALGFIDPKRGFKKLGFLYRTCFTNVVNRVYNWWRQAGLSSSQIYKQSLGCNPTGVTDPTTIRRAALNMHNAGVTSVTYVESVADIGSFTKAAKAYHFRYGLPDDELVVLTETGSATAADPTALNGALAVASARDAEETTSGLRPTAGTQRCDAIFGKAHIPPTYRDPYAGGNACDDVWMFEAMVNHASSVQPQLMAAGFQSAGSIDLSFPQGPTDYRSRGETAGGQYYRYLTFVKGGCPSWYGGSGHQGASGGCWRVSEAAFHRSTYAP